MVIPQLLGASELTSDLHLTGDPGVCLWAGHSHWDGEGVAHHYDMERQLRIHWQQHHQWSLLQGECLGPVLLLRYDAVQDF